MSFSGAVQPSQLSTFSGPVSSSFIDHRNRTLAHEAQLEHHHQSGQPPGSGGTSTPAQGSSSGSGPPSSGGGQDNETTTTAVSCKQCGSTELDSDPSRGDTVCMSCGYVLEESLIVSEVCFEEDGHGGASAIGQFVSSESKGGGGIGLSGGGAGGNYHQGVGKESREITLRAAKRKITEVAQQLRLNQHHIDMSFNFFKMALHKQLTKGRRHPLTVAACIYMTCRIEGTPHLLIDFSDVVQMDIYALGRAYIQLSRALFINIPAVDPCMYILRFAHKFNLGKKTHEVGMTAVRLVQRMKRDWLHLGRRPSGLCGAALLIAARLHNFSRTVQDVIQVVKVHETTLRKRLIEFGETPSSSLTIEEFMSVDLEEEHDPPSFKMARIKDREHLQRLMDQEDVNTELTDLQRKIEEELERRRRIRTSKEVQAKGGVPLPRGLGLESVLEHGAVSGTELESASRFIIDSTLSTIHTIISDNDQHTTHPSSPVKMEGQKSGGVRTRSRVRSDSGSNSNSAMDMDRILMPPPSPALTSTSILSPRPGPLSLPPPSPCPPSPSDRRLSTESTGSTDDPHEDHSEGEDENTEGGELDFSDLDDAEIDSYIMSDTEAERKRVIWEKLNNDYIVEQERKKVQMEQDILEGKFDKKKKAVISATGAKIPKGPSTIAGGSTFQAKSASEAIKIMLTERRMSSKINYDVLKKLASSVGGDDDAGVRVKEDNDKEMITVIESGPIIPASKRRRDAAAVKQEPPDKKSRRAIKEEKRREEESSAGTTSKAAVTSDTEADASELSQEEDTDAEHEAGGETEEEEMVEHGEEVEEDVEEEEQEEEGDEEVEEVEEHEGEDHDHEGEEPEVEEVDDSVVVETGPVTAPPAEEPDEEYEEEAEDIEDDEDEAHVSARDLLTKFRGDDEGEEGYEDYYD